MSWDIALFYFINHLPHSSILNGAALLIHYLSRGGIIYCPFIIFGFFAANKKYRRLALVLALGMLLTFITTDLFLKNVTHRLRPFLGLAQVAAVQPLPASFSFPSGQAAIAAYVAITLWLMKTKKSFTAAAIVLALLVGLDRVYMGHHYPSDVLAGYIVGAVIAYVLFTLINPSFRRPPE